MITQQHLDNFTLRVPSRGQMLTAELFLRWDYLFPRKTHIIIENIENIPRDKAVIYAMNHTDNYNYWPFMYKLYRQGDHPSIAPWVKGKYYKNPLLKFFFDANNNIPLPSRGYLLTKDFQATVNRLPTRVEYRLLRNLIDERLTPDKVLAQATDAVKQVITTARHTFNPNRQPYGEYMEATYNRLMARVAEISRDALLNKNISLLIFPQGTRSIRLLPGLTGLAQIALKTGAPVVPVGCNGSDQCYRNILPFSAGGKIVYRVGKPLTPADDLAPFTINRPYQPFTRTAAKQFKRQFQKATDLIMNRINQLLDPQYQFAPDAEAIAGTGVGRFI